MPLIILCRTVPVTLTTLPGRLPTPAPTPVPTPSTTSTTTTAKTVSTPTPVLSAVVPQFFFPDFDDCWVRCLATRTTTTTVTTTTTTSTTTKATTTGTGRLLPDCRFNPSGGRCGCRTPQGERVHSAPNRRADRHSLVLLFVESTQAVRRAARTATSCTQRWAARVPATLCTLATASTLRDARAARRRRYSSASTRSTPRPASLRPASSQGSAQSSRAPNVALAKNGAAVRSLAPCRRRLPPPYVSACSYTMIDF